MSKNVKIVLLSLAAIALGLGLFGLIGMMKMSGQAVQQKEAGFAQTKQVTQEKAKNAASSEKDAAPQKAAVEAGAVNPKVGEFNVEKSPYFVKLDFYNNAPTKSCLLLKNFKTRQQETPFSCGAACALMVINYLDPSNKVTEADLISGMGTNRFNGTRPSSMERYFVQKGWIVESSLKDRSPATEMEFKGFVIDHLSRNMPIIVENVDWGGHYRVIIGYDDMGTATVGDDVLILADPYDYTDHAQDGYAVISANKFFYMWFDAKLYSGKEKDKVWIAIKKK